jgi:competence protein ComEA
VEKAAWGRPFLSPCCAQNSGMNITPSLAAITGASLVAVVVAFVLRPAQLAPHPTPTLSAAPREIARAAAPVAPRVLVYVAGAVVHPGVYAISGEARAQDALAKAGGPTRDADLVAVNLAAHVSDGDEIAVPHQGDVRSTTPARSAHRRASSGASRRTRRRPRSGDRSTDGTGAAAAAIVDINAADAHALAELPGIGQTLAERIVEFRSLNGSFASVDGLADVSGITPQRLEILTPLLSVGR